MDTAKLAQAIHHLIKSTPRSVGPDEIEACIKQHMTVDVVFDEKRWVPLVQQPGTKTVTERCAGPLQHPQDKSISTTARFGEVSDDDMAWAEQEYHAAVASSLDNATASQNIRLTPLQIASKLSPF